MKPKLSMAVQYAIKPANAPTRHQFKKWAQVALGQDAEIALRLVDAKEGRELNLTWRGKDYATNVLTFPLMHDPLLMGDIVLCAPIIEQEAAEQGISVESHYAHLTVHSVLHMQGYDHENDADAEIMEALESQIVIKLGYADPYLIEKDAIQHGG